MPKPELENATESPAEYKKPLALSLVSQVHPQEAVEADPVVLPYNLKGDCLGMTLGDFKKRHQRWVAGHNEPIPWCSDSRPGEEIASLMSEPYFASAGLVNCRLDFPFEQIQGCPAPSVAGVQTKALIYHFVAERLYQISVAFELEDTAAVAEALAAKYGTPHRYDETMWMWDNGISAISLRKGRRKNQWASSLTILLFVHHHLKDVAESLKPGPAVHDL